MKDKTELLPVATCISFITPGGGVIQQIVIYFAVWGELNAVMSISLHSFLYSFSPHIVVGV